MYDNYPPGFNPGELDTPGPMSENDLANYIDDNIGILQEYYVDHVNPGCLDDDIVDGADGWIETLSEDDIIKIVNKD